MVRALRFLPVAMIGLTATVGGCATAPPPPAPPSAPAATTTPTPTPTPTTPPVVAPSTGALPGPSVPVPAAADGTRYSSCSDGRCEVEVSGTATIPVPGATSFTVSTTGQPDEIAFAVRPRGVEVTSGGGPRAGTSLSSDDRGSTGTLGGPGGTITTRRVVVRFVAGDGSRAVVAVTPA